MKKILAVILALTMLLALAACGAPAAEAPAATDAPVEATEAPAEPTEAPVETAEESAEPVTVRLAALTGPTAMGMAKVFSDADAGTAANDYEYALYGAADAPRSRYARLCEEYLRTFGDAPDALLISAPGRTELAGNHTDHQLGIVLCAAVTLDAAAAAASVADNAVEIVSDGFGRVRVSLDDLAPRESEAGTTAALIRGVAAGFSAGGLRIGGWRACIHSLVPAGGGLSSSAAFEILTGAIFSALYNGGRVDALTLARIGQSAERNYFGKPSGLMDQAASAFGGITKIDFAGGDRPDVTRIAFDFRAHGYILCAVNTHSRHDDLTPDYAAIPRDMTAVARAFGKDVLRQVNPAAFAAPEMRERLARDISPVAADRAEHFFAEDERVERMAAALLEGGQEEDGLEETARSLSAALEGEDELALFEATQALDKLSREELTAVLDRTLIQIGARLPGSQRPRRLLAAAELLRRLRDGADLNANPGQVAGWLCAGMFLRP